MRKEKKTNRIVSLMLALIVILSLVPMNALATQNVAKVGDKEYTTLEEAVNAAESGTTKTVILLADTIVSDNLTIPAGVTLLLPCSDDDTGYDSSAGFDTDNHNPDGTATVNPTLYRTMTIANDATLIVKGTVLVNAVTGYATGGTHDQTITGNYSKIALNGSLNVEDGGILDVCGSITGSGTVTAESGSSVYETYVINNWRGGSQAAVAIGLFYPYNQYSMHTIESKLILNSDADLSGNVKMYAGGKYSYTRFPQVDKTNGLIRLASGAALTQIYDANEDRSTITIEGGATFASSSLQITNSSMSTKNYLYPVDGDMTFNLNNGTYTFANSYKFLTGSILNTKNADMVISKDASVVFYNKFNDVRNIASTTDPETTYPQRSAAVFKLDADSSLIINGAFAGDATVTSTESSITKGDDAVLSVISKEANGYYKKVDNKNYSVDLTFNADFICGAYKWTWSGNKISWSGGSSSSGGSSGGGSTGGGSTSTSATSSANTTVTSDNISITTASVSGSTDKTTGKTTATVEAGTLKTLLSSAKTAESAGKEAVVAIKVKTESTTKSAELTIPGDTFADIAENTDADVKVDTGIGILTFDKSAVESISKAAGTNNICVSIDDVDSSGFSANIQQLVGDRPVYDFFVAAGDKKISTFGGGSVSVSIPYTLKSGENANAIVVYYLDDSGDAQAVQGAYHKSTGTVDFTASHFSQYAVGYHEVSFTDVSTDAWYQNAVGFIAARGITTGTSANTFNPDTAITRGQFMVMLMRAYGIEPDESPSDNFADGGSTYYTNYLAKAKEMGIATGTGNNIFMPDNKISRQDMFTLLYRTLDQLGELPEETASNTLSSFSDTTEISNYAKEAFETFVGGGIISGSEGKLTPKAPSTRAQMAQILYNLLSA